jgi:hypothetical protein
MTEPLKEGGTMKRAPTIKSAAFETPKMVDVVDVPVMFTSAIETPDPAGPEAGTDRRMVFLISNAEFAPVGFPEIDV